MGPGQLFRYADGATIATGRLRSFHSRRVLLQRRRDRRDPDLQSRRQGDTNLSRVHVTGEGYLVQESLRCNRRLENIQAVESSCAQAAKTQRPNRIGTNFVESFRARGRFWPRALDMFYDGVTDQSLNEGFSITF